MWISVSLGSSLVGVAMTVGGHVALRAVVVQIEPRGKENIFVYVFLNIIMTITSTFHKRWSPKPVFILLGYSMGDRTVSVTFKYDCGGWSCPWSCTQQVRTDIGHL